VPLQFVLIPLLFWATLRFAERGASTAAVVITAFATIGTIHGNGPFVRASVNESLLLLQAFLGVIVTSSLFLAGVLSERKRAEEKVSESEARLNTILDNVGAAIFIKDTNYRYTYANRKVCEIFGRSADEIQGKNDREFFSDGSVEEIMRSDRPVIERGETISREETGLTSSDNVPHTYWSIKLPLQDGSGRISGLVGISTDITDRKRAEEDRERLIGELELRNAELERFTYTVSHDLKSPLITMRGFLGYLEKDALAGNTERLRADIGRITDAADKMDRLLRELLELSRIGRAMNPPEQVPFEQVVREALGLVAGHLQEGGIRVEIAAGMPVVSGDHVRLVEVVQNLVENAAKFMGSQPAPLIEVGARAEERDGKPVFFVRDNGIGIEPQYQEKIFGLFDKLDNRTEGSGIGLALVKRIIEVHGGTIWVESQGSGSGATFCFTLPRANTTMKNGG
jgi:PAS domain S-box-containing protein